MTREEHAKKAEELLKAVQERGDWLNGRLMSPAEASTHYRSMDLSVSIAQVHATLSTRPSAS